MHTHSHRGSVAATRALPAGTRRRASAGRGARLDAGTAAVDRARVAIAGATGYAGQELLRLLARHPAITITAATASGTAAAGRRLPGLARVWDGEIQPLNSALLARDTDVVFLALPDAAAAEHAPALV